MQEIVTWNIAAEHKPDDSMTVICWCDDEYFCGWWESERSKWIDFSGMPVDVTHWCQIDGPMGCDQQAVAVEDMEWEQRN